MRERAHNHSGFNASEQSQSHEIALHLPSEHVSAATVLFDFRGLGRKSVERRAHVFLRLGSLPEQAVAYTWVHDIAESSRKRIT